MTTHFIPQLVSVIVPVFNRVDLVGKTLDSILEQTYPYVEIIAINDGSTDDTLAVLCAYANKYPNQIVVVDQKNTGQVRARNNGIERANGEFIAFLDSDDTWEKEKLTLQIPLFNEKVGLVYCSIYEVNESGDILRTVPCESAVKGNVYGMMLINNRMTGGSVVVTRKALDKVGLFDESFQAAENWDLWIRISKEYQVDYVNIPLVRYRKHQGNMSHDIKRMADASWAILHKHLPCKPAQGELLEIYNNAYANYYYRLGVSNFSAGHYAQSRTFFYYAWRYNLFIKDSALRVFRSFLGRRVNRMLTKRGNTLK